MNNVVKLSAPATGGADARERFEAWARSKLTKTERETFFIRSKGGEYVRPSIKMAWCAWQAAIADLIGQYVADRANPK